MTPCILFEDEHLLVVNKPAGCNTHAPSPYAGEGIYDWLKNREARWVSLAIIHRLDKETSGVMVFGKTPLANRSLTEQFTQRGVRKEYLLLTDLSPKRREFTVNSKIVRIGERYTSSLHGEPAQTRFRALSAEETERRSPTRRVSINHPHRAGSETGALVYVEAEPLTGRTHQIRVHAAESGFPILGDTLYGGTPAARLFLHAMELTFRHPASGEEVRFCSSPDFAADPRLALRTALIEPDATNAFRLIHGDSDGWSGWYVDKLGDFLLSQSGRPLSDRQREFLKVAMSNALLIKHHASRITAAYHKVLTRHVRRTSATDATPQLVSGEAAPERFAIRENGVRFELSFNEGYSVGLFLDQRDNRRRFLTGYVSAGFPLFQSAIRNPQSLTLSPTPVAFPFVRRSRARRRRALISQKNISNGANATSR